MIERAGYIEKLDGYRDTDLIKVVTGIRRCGKSTLLAMFQSRLKDAGVPESSIVAVDFDDLDMEPLLDYHALHEYLKGKTSGTGRYYVFLDEVQRVADFQKVAASLYRKKNIDIYLSGSNAQILSGELATLLSGRHVAVNMLPLSLREFAQGIAWTDRANPERLYAKYLEVGSFPYALTFAADMRQVREYLGSLYDTILVRDVAARKQSVNAQILDKLAKFMLSNVGNITSVRKIADTMCSMGQKISAPTAESYLAGMIDAFFIYRARRYDAQGKRLLGSNDKFYAADIGMRNNLLGQTRHDTSHALENIVYLELLRRGYDVFVGKVDEFEIDFVAMQGGIPSYFQVSETVKDPDVLARELRPLKMLRDNHPKTLLTLDVSAPADIDGIIVRNALDFLL
jgi:predicted AAA+ superfamily ATPase